MLGEPGIIPDLSEDQPADTRPSHTTKTTVAVALTLCCGSAMEEGMLNPASWVKQQDNGREERGRCQAERDT